ncbi:MAG: STAS domain-containing protein [Herminiimonas sp.]|nr:STAS domain-containing protein [Herminiimonas sp.]
MFRPTLTMTVNNVSAVLDAGLRAVASGETDFDFSELTAVDSSAVAALLAWQRAAVRQKTQLVFSNVPVSLQSLATLYGVAELLPFNAATTPRTDLPHH